MIIHQTCVTAATLLLHILQTQTWTRVFRRASFEALLSVGVHCELDAWSEYAAVVSPEARQDASVVWDPETQSALMFGGHASSAFLYFADLWSYDWPQRAWFQILNEDSRQGGVPGAASRADD